MQTIQPFPRSFSPGDTPYIVAVLHTDEEELEGALAVADLFRLETEEPVAEGLDVEGTFTESSLTLACRLPAEFEVAEEPAPLATGTYFLRFRVTFSSGNVLTIPPDDRLRLRVR